MPSRSCADAAGYKASSPWVVRLAVVECIKVKLARDRFLSDYEPKCDIGCMKLEPIVRTSEARSTFRNQVSGKKCHAEQKHNPGGGEFNATQRERAKPFAMRQQSERKTFGAN
jgi:hypothetical protein